MSKQDMNALKQVHQRADLCIGSRFPGHPAGLDLSLPGVPSLSFADLRGIPIMPSLYFSSRSASPLTSRSSYLPIFFLKNAKAQKGRRHRPRLSRYLKVNASRHRQERKAAPNCQSGCRRSDRQITDRLGYNEAEGAVAVN